MTQFKHLFEPIMIGTMELKNRLMMPGLSCRLGSESGNVTDRMANYYAERAKGGAGYIVCEVLSVVWPMGCTQVIGPRIDNDVFIPGLAYLTESVHAQGAKIAAEINHAGREGYPRRGYERVSASNTISARHNEPARGLTTKEVEEMVENFGQAARRAMRAGFDAVEVQASHGYLISNFLSPDINKRTDRYGGDIYGRLTFPLEIYRRVREEVGDLYPIQYRINGSDLVEGGQTIDDSTIVAQELEKVGVNSISVSGGRPDSTKQSSVSPMSVPRGHLVQFAEKVKKVVNIPVITAGRINNPVLAESIIQDGKADIIAMGRALVCDPYLPNKAAEGRLDDIRPCIACGACTGSGGSLGCISNIEIGFERERKIVPTQRPKTVLIAGGGPAGMEAARVAALRGHKVLLYEKDGSLGGQLNLAEMPPGKGEISNLTKYLTGQVKKLGVEIHLNKEFTLEVFEEIKPDVVVLATGSVPIIPKINGINRSNVVTAWDILAGKVSAGQKTVIVGGGQVGCECAEFLAETGGDVTLVEMLDVLAPDMKDLFGRKLLLQRLNDLGVKILCGTVVDEISDEGVVCIDKKKEKHICEADTVVLSVGSTPNNSLLTALRGKIYDLYAVGDAVSPRKAWEAIHEGSLVARRI